MAQTTSARALELPVIPELLYLALDFYREPRRFDRLRQAGQPLPPGVSELLSAPTHCLADDQIAATAAALNATEQECRDCVPFFIKQVMLEVPGDYYRVLGVEQNAAQAQVKEHYRYLMRLFHPDRDVHNEGWDDLYAPRINEAYNTLRNADKRADYNASLAPQDGFNPQQLSQNVPTSFQSAPEAAKPLVTRSAAPGFLRSPWFYAVLAVCCVLVLFGVLLGSNQTTQLTVTQNETGQTSRAVVPQLEDSALPKDSPALESEAAHESMRSATGNGDQDIEALVRARVDQATVAVLGKPRPKVRPKAAPESESTLQPLAKAKAEPQVIPKAQPAPVAEQAVITVAVIEPEPEPEPEPEDQVERAIVVAVEQPASAPIEVAIVPIESLEQERAISVQAPVEESMLPAVNSEPPVQTAVAAVAAVAVEAASAPVEASVSQPEPPAKISNADVELLLSQFANAYEAGDASLFARFFATDARTTDADGRPAIQRLYAGFFAETDVQEFSIDRLKMKGDDAAERDCRASVSIATQPKSGGELTVVETDIRFDIGRSATGALQIERMRY